MIPRPYFRYLRRPPTAAAVATVTVSPATASLTAGQTVQLSAAVKDAGGNVLTDRTVTWFSSDESLATVDSTGLVTTLAEGSVLVVASTSGVEDSATVTISSASSAALGAPNYLFLAANGPSEVQLNWLPSQRHGRGDGWEAEYSVDGGATWSPATLVGVVAANTINKNTSASFRVGYDRTPPAVGASPLKVLYRLYETSGGVRGPVSDEVEVYLPVDGDTPVEPQATVDASVPTLVTPTQITLSDTGVMNDGATVANYTNIQAAFDAAADAAVDVELLIRNGAKFAGNSVVQLKPSAVEHQILVRPEDDSFLPAPTTRFVPATHDPAATATSGNCPILEATTGGSGVCIGLKSSNTAAPSRWRFTGLRMRAKNGVAPTTFVNLAPDPIVSMTGLSAITFTRSTQTLSMPAGGFLAAGFAAGQYIKGTGVLLTDRENHPWRIVSVTDAEIVVDGDWPDLSVPTPKATATLNAYDINALPEYITFDRCWSEGRDASLGNLTRAHYWAGRHIALVDSYVEKIEQTSADAQAVNAVTGPGPMLIRNCFLEATGENIMTGGSNPLFPCVIPRDVTVEDVHFSKPAHWDPTSPETFDGTYRAVKNAWEIKHVGRFALRRYTWDRQINGSGQQTKAFPIKEGQSDSAPWVDSHDILVEWGRGYDSFGFLAVAGMYYPGNGNQSLTSTRRVTVRQHLVELVPGSWYYRGVTLSPALAGDGMTTSFAGSTGATPVWQYPGGSVTIRAGVLSLTDDGAGVLSGDGTGTIDYATGAITMEWSTPPAAGASIRIWYWRARTMWAEGIQQGQTMLSATFEHNTVVMPSGTLNYAYMIQGGVTPSASVRLRNNVFDAAQTGIKRDHNNSTAKQNLLTGLTAATTGGNLWIGQAAAEYPDDDACPADPGAAGMTGYASGDYRIAAGSAYAPGGASYVGTDGTAPGCDIDTLTTNLAGVS